MDILNKIREDLLIEIRYREAYGKSYKPCENMAKILFDRYEKHHIASTMADQDDLLFYLYRNKTTIYNNKLISNIPLNKNIDIWRKGHRSPSTTKKNEIDWPGTLCMNIFSQFRYKIGIKKNHKIKDYSIYGSPWTSCITIKDKIYYIGITKVDLDTKTIKEKNEKLRSYESALLYFNINNWEDLLERYTITKKDNVSLDLFIQLSTKGVHDMYIKGKYTKSDSNLESTSKLSEYDFDLNNNSNEDYKTTCRSKKLCVFEITKYIFDKSCPKESTTDFHFIHLYTSYRCTDKVSLENSSIVDVHDICHLILAVKYVTPYVVSFSPVTISMPWTFIAKILVGY